MGVKLHVEPGDNPAVALYGLWDSVLDLTDLRWMSFGQPGWGLARCGEDVIALIQLHGGGQGYSEHFWLSEEGHFRFGYMFGWYRRRNVALAAPFLNWSYVAGKYQWTVDFTENKGSWNRNYLVDYETPRHYLSESILGADSWGNTKYFELERTDEWTEGWKMMPATRTKDPLVIESRTQIVRSYEELIRKRNLKMHNLTLAAQGLPAITERSRDATLRTGGVLLQREQATARLLAHLQAEEPARITPITKKPKEANRGADHMDSTHRV